MLINGNVRLKMFSIGRGIFIRNAKNTFGKRNKTTLVVTITLLSIYHEYKYVGERFGVGKMKRLYIAFIEYLSYNRRCCYLVKKNNFFKKSQKVPGRLR